MTNAAVLKLVKKIIIIIISYYRKHTVMVEFLYTPLNIYCFNNIVVAIARLCLLRSR